MQKSIYVVGASGYFGSKLVKYFQEKNWQVYTEKIDFLNPQEVHSKLSNTFPSVVLNAAGMTGKPNVDFCETHIAETFTSNITGPLNLAVECEKLGLYFVHLSSGCIYDGTNNGQGFTEEDLPNYTGSAYSRSKALCEQILKEFNPLQLRIRIPIEATPNPKNVIDKLVKYQHIISLPNSFTVLEDFLPATYQLIERKEKGIFNMTNVGWATQEDIMLAYTKYVKPSFKYSIISLNELKEKYVKAGRSNAVLDVSKREALGISMPDIKLRLPDLMKSYEQKLNERISVR